LTPAEWAAVALLTGVALGYWGARTARRPHDASTTPAASPQVAVPSAADAPARASGENVFAALVRALPIGVIAVNREYHVEFANAAAGTTFGFDPARVIGLHVIKAVPNLELERRIAEALRGEASVAPMMLLGAAPGERTFRISVYPLLDDEGQRRRVMIFSEDQTTPLRLDRARKEFLSNVSHELRTPLSSIKLMLETVLEAPEVEARELFVPQALSQVDRLNALVGQLLEQARAESGQLQLALREVDLEDVAASIVASFEQQAANKGVSLELTALRPVVVEADPDRLAQVFVNFIDNALRHTNEGGRIRIELDARDSDAILRVRDNGSGIPYRDLPHIFERFYVVDRSRTRGSGGAGLGLAIVKNIVDAHGGAVSAESMLGRGTSFTVRLPIMRIKRETTRA
jgi:signal transduction histidine kinase